MKRIPEAPEYSVTSNGKVYSHKYGKLRELKQYLVEGYYKVTLHHNGVRTAPKVHHLVLEAYFGPRPEGYVTRHLDGNKLNNDIINLAWGTYEENESDKIAHGTSARGTNNASNKLSEIQVLEIRQLHKDRVPHKAIADEYRVTVGTVSKIGKRVIWKWLE